MRKAHKQLLSLHRCRKVVELFNGDGLHAVAASYSEREILNVDPQEPDYWVATNFKLAHHKSTLYCFQAAQGRLPEVKKMDIALVNPPVSSSNDLLFYSLLAAQTMIRDKGYVQAVIPLQLATSPSFMDRIDDLGLECIDNTQELTRKSTIKGFKGPQVIIVLFQKKWDLSYGRLQFALANFANLYDMMIEQSFKGGIYVTGCLCPSMPSPSTQS